MSMIADAHERKIDWNTLNAFWDEHFKNTNPNTLHIPFIRGQPGIAGGSKLRLRKKRFAKKHMAQLYRSIDLWFKEHGIPY